jgi:hypothetical protein
MFQGHDMIFALAHQFRQVFVTTFSKDGTYGKIPNGSYRQVTTVEK